MDHHQSGARSLTDPSRYTEAQSELEPLYPDLERCIAPLLQRLGYNGRRSRAAAIDYMNVSRVCEQVDLLTRYSGSLEGKKVLEVGSGFGLFVAFTNRFLRAECTGIEPAESEFESTYQFSTKLLNKWSVDPFFIKRGKGESIPFEDDHFDVVYSTNVLEHVQDPQLVIQESVRVLKPGGTMQIIVPNYGSFWEGHYAVPWIPYSPKFLAKAYLRGMGKDPWFVDTLNLINYFSLQKLLKSGSVGDQVEIVDWGQDLFFERMTQLNFSEWGGLSVLKRWVRSLSSIGLSRPAAILLIFFKAHTPLILTLRKKQSLYDAR